MSASSYSRSTTAIISVIVVAVLLIALNIIFNNLRIRGDLTENNVYTLSQGTREILKDLKEKDHHIQINFYYSKDLKTIPPYYKAFAKRIEDFLKEYEVHASSHISIERLNPKPDSDAADRAMMEGIKPTRAPSGEDFYLGLTLTLFGRTETIPFLNIAEEDQLEYEISSRIWKLMNPEQKRVGVLSTLPVMGSQKASMMPGMPSQGEKPWFIIQQMQEFFEVLQLPTDTDSISNKLDVLVIIHPKDLPDKTLFAIDQYLMNGGRIMIFLDAYSVAEQQELVKKQGQQAAMSGPPAPSQFDKLLQAWGVTLESESVIADKTYAYKERKSQYNSRTFPSFLVLPADALNSELPVTGQLDTVTMFASGYFSGKPAENLAKTTLIETSDSAQTIKRLLANATLDKLPGKLQGESQVHDLAIQLSGTFKSAFPAGAPEGQETDNEAESHREPENPILKESLRTTTVALFADTDMLSDAANVQQRNFMGQTVTSYFSDNIALLQNLMEQLAGDNELISIRSRGTEERPLTKIREMEKEAKKEYIQTIKELEAEIQQTDQRLQTLQQKFSNSQSFVRSPEVKKELEALQKKRGRTNERLKEKRKALRRGIEKLEFKIKLLNIMVVPFLVLIAGIGVAIFKHVRMKGAQA